MQPEGVTCPECGSSYSSRFQFCPTCGIRILTPALATPEDDQPPADSDLLTAAPAAVPAPAADPGRAERRLVSVLFVDLVGFTTISEQLDPEDVREIQSRYFESARSTIARYGGSLEKFIGDAVMAVWGSPVARENDAERAVRAALELLRSIGSMAGATPTGTRLNGRAAITTGEAAVAFDIAGEGMVTGDMVNTASRLQEAAAPGTVLVDDATRRAVGGGVRFEAAGEKLLKGKASTVRAWLAIEATAAEAADSVAGHRGPFVGRAPEMAALLALTDSAIDQRRTTLVSIIGVAGIGKSRLIREVERRTADRPGLRWYRGRPPRWGQGTAFAPLAEMVRHSIGVGEHDPAEVVRRTLAENLNRLVADDAERAWLEPRVLVMLDPTARIQAERDELFAAWRRFLEAEAAERALVLAFEDLQWADVETLDFIDYLATWSRRHPILILTIARPELLESRPTWGAGIPQFRSMHLERLRDSEVDQLLNALAPALPADVAARIRQRAEGVPLYAVEIARMVSERMADGGSGVGTADIPESLHALLAARIDDLPEQERSVLLMAAVLGRRFRPDVLAALAGMDRRELGDLLGTLVRREFLVMDDQPSSPGRGQLSFMQDLMREVAYGTLSRRDRRRYHLAITAHLEASDGPESIEPIAEHLVAAHAAARVTADETHDLGQRAVDALRQAADHAAELHAPHRALAHLERALVITSDPSLRAELTEAAAMSARAAARFAIAEVHLREAIDLRESLGDTAGATRDRAHLASVLLQAQRSDAALAELEGAWQAYSAAGDHDAALVHLAAELARAYMLRADTARAVEWAERAIGGAGAELDGSRAYATDARVSLGTALAQGGKPDEGLAELRMAIDEATRTGLPTIELRARANLAWLMASDDPRAAAETARRGLELARQLGSREWSLQLLDISGFVAIDTGDWDSAIAELDEVPTADLPTAYRLDFSAMRATIQVLRGADDALAPVEQLGPPEPDLDPHALGWTESARALEALTRGQLDEALRLAKAAAARTIGLERAEALALTGRIAAWGGWLDEAAAALSALEDESQWGRATRARLQTLRAAEAALQRSAGPDPAATVWEEALRGWRELDLPYREALCLADRWMLRGADADREAAIGLLERLGAQGLIAMLRMQVPTGTGSITRS